jgi:hypothetical protein
MLRTSGAVFAMTMDAPHALRHGALGTTGKIVVFRTLWSADAQSAATLRAPSVLPIIVTTTSRPECNASASGARVLRSTLCIAPRITVFAPRSWITEDGLLDVVGWRTIGSIK